MQDPGGGARERRRAYLLTGRVPGTAPGAETRTAGLAKVGRGHTTFSRKGASMRRDTHGGWLNKKGFTN